MITYEDELSSDRSLECYNFGDTLILLILQVPLFRPLTMPERSPQFSQVTFIPR